MPGALAAAPTPLHGLALITDVGLVSTGFLAPCGESMVMLAFFVWQEPQRFVHQMETYFNGISWHDISADTSGVISDMMEILRKNQARLAVLRTD